MATLSRQPFAPLDGTRLQGLTSLKNRQNAIASPSASKRKAESIEIYDSENVDPLSFAKRSKADASSTPSKDFSKSSSYILTKSTAAPSLDTRSVLGPKKSNPISRRTLQPKSPAAKLITSNICKSSPLSAPAGRSPTRGKRAGLLSNRRRTAGPYSRVDPPAFHLDAAAPFSLDAALKGTIAGFAASKPTPAPKDSFTALYEPEMKASWTFDIHEDTPEQEMTNLLQHSTCVLDISSDEESERKANREQAEGRNKENVPPVDDVSQTSTRRPARSNPDDMVVEKERIALGEMNAADFYAEGCDESSVILILEDDEEQPAPESVPALDNEPEDASAEPKSLPPSPQTQEDIDALMSKPTLSSSKAAVLAPIEGTGESFELWESDSTKDESEGTAATSS